MAPERADGTHVVVGVDANRRRLAAAMAFGILSLTVMLMYATNSLSFATLESISRELNNPISLLIDTSEPEYTPLSTSARKRADTRTGRCGPPARPYEY